MEAGKFAAMSIEYRYTLNFLVPLLRLKKEKNRNKKKFEDEPDFMAEY